MSTHLKFAARQSTIARREFIKFGAAAGALIACGGPRAAFSQIRTIPSAGSIDVHSHWAPQAYMRALNQMRTPTGDTPNPLDFDLDKRTKWMDQHGVQMHTLTLSGAMPWQWVKPDEGAHLAQIINDAAVEAHTAFPSRFVSAVEMSIRSPELSLKELNRMAGKPAMRAVHLPNSFENRDYIFEPAYAPLLARCEALGYPLLFHPLDGEINYYGGKERLGGKWQDSANMSNTLGFPFDTATLAAKFIISGTLDKYPRLQIVLPHAGGAFPYVAGRIEHGLTRRKFKLQHPFREYVRRFHYDTLAYYPETLRFMISLVGADRVVIGTDNFAGMDVEQPNALVEQLNLPPEDRERILRGNATRLLRI
jgi:aminocarboxymuconate-semialdehyde decarboxylase